MRTRSDPVSGVRCPSVRFLRKPDRTDGQTGRKPDANRTVNRTNRTPGGDENIFQRLAETLQSIDRTPVFPALLWHGGETLFITIVTGQLVTGFIC